MYQPLLLYSWCKQVAKAFASLTKPQSFVLAAFSFGIVRAQRCALARIAERLFSLGKADSVERRLQRFLANSKIGLEQGCRCLAGWVLSSRVFGGKTLVLLVDETSLGEHLKVMAVCLAYRGRAIPLAWWCYHQERYPMKCVELIDTLLVDATAGNVTNANIPLPRGNALVYGRVTDNSGQPFVNIKVDGGTAGNAFDSKGYTDANGNYAVAILSGTSVSADVDTPTYGSPVLNYIWNTPDGIGSLGAGQAAEQDFVGLPAVGIISGRVQDNGGTNIVGVGLYANATVNGLSYTSLEGTTDDLGHYSLVVGPGQWNVFCLTGGHSNDNLDQLGYEDLTAPHYVSVPPTNAVLNLTVYPFGTPFITAPRRLSPTQFGFTVFGASNVNYTVQVATNLTSPNWLNVYSFQLLSNSISLTDSTATNAPRYYRIVK